MDFREAPRRAPQENLLPMINVVFLLLIFFLISARLTAPEPFAVLLPEAQAEAEAEAEGQFTLFVGADGQIGYRDTLEDAALAALATALAAHCESIDCQTEAPLLTLRADAALPAARFAALLPRLGNLHRVRLELVVERAAP